MKGQEVEKKEESAATLRDEKITQIEKWNESASVPKEDISWLLGEVKRTQTLAEEQAKKIKELAEAIDKLLRIDAHKSHALTLWLALRGSSTEDDFVNSTKSLAAQTTKALNGGT